MVLFGNNFVWNLWSIPMNIGDRVRLNRYYSTYDLECGDEGYIIEVIYLNEVITHYKIKVDCRFEICTIPAGFVDYVNVDYDNNDCMQNKMNNQEALQALYDGKKIRGTDWYKLNYIYIDKNNKNFRDQEDDMIFLQIDSPDQEWEEHIEPLKEYSSSEDRVWDLKVGDIIELSDENQEKITYKVVYVCDNYACLEEESAIVPWVLMRDHYVNYDIYQEDQVNKL